MLTFKKIITVTLLAIFPMLMQAQENDSIEIHILDTIYVDITQPRKAESIIGVAIPTAMIGYGALSFYSKGIRQLDYSTNNKLLENNSLWHNNWDDYLQYTPAVAAFGMKFSGVKSQHKLSDMAIIYVLSNALEKSVVGTLKGATHRQRPNGENNYSFPSGHTGTAFVAAEFLHQEYKDKSIWISVGGYSMATLIGVSRIYNNKHWVSDVVAGAGIGILSTKIIYWTYPYLQKIFSKEDKKFRTVYFPSYSDGNLCLNFNVLILDK